MDRTSIQADDKFDMSDPKTLFPESDLDRGVVGWESQTDPKNPRNFSSAKKWTTMILISNMLVLSFLASSILSPAATLISAEFHNPSALLTSFLTTIYTLGFMVGPLLLSPLSELYGRRPLLDFSNFLFTLSHIGAGLAPNTGTLLAFRLLSGLGGSASLSIGAGIVADLFPVPERAVPSTLLTLGSMFGPVLGPLLGGAITAHAGWRCIFWALLAASGAGWAAVFFFAAETHGAALLRLKTATLRTALARPDLLAACDADKAPAELRTATVLVRSFARPWRMLARSPVLVLLSALVGLASGLLYLLLTTTAPFFRDVYGWPLETCGLAYLGLGAGSAVGLVLFAATSDGVARRLADRSGGGGYVPEMRMATMFLPALCIPVSFFWYGWAAEGRVHWVVPLIGLAPFGFATVGVNASAQAYVIDAAGPCAASAMAGLTAVRCLFGAFLPLAGPGLYGALGLGWGNSLVGFVSLAMVPFPVVVWRWGARLRERFPLDKA